ncbi:MAG: histidine phosphatase family protein [Rickettsiaceae bacterium]|nr:histidine phosphatase family protein [Rickettsiaceae bacterium]
MKKLFLMRHASAPHLHGMADIERTLSESGKKEAEQAADFLAKNYQLDLIISSTAPRSIETAKIISKKSPLAKMVQEDLIYIGSKIDIIRYMEQLSDEYDNICIVGHNPIISVIPESDIYNMKVMSTGQINIFNVENWQDVNYSAKLIDRFVPVP